MKDLQKTKGTIASVLTENKDLINSLINQGDYNKVQNEVENILTTSNELKTNKDVTTCINTLRTCLKRNINLYLSTLMTYMLGMKVS